MENPICPTGEAVVAVVNKSLRAMGDIMVRLSGEMKVSFNSADVGWTHFNGWVVSGDVGAMVPADSSQGDKTAFSSLIANLREVQFVPFSNLADYEKWLPTKEEWNEFVDNVQKAVLESEDTSFLFFFVKNEIDGEPNTEPSCSISIKLLHNFDVDYLIKKDLGTDVPLKGIETTEEVAYANHVNLTEAVVA